MNYQQCQQQQKQATSNVPVLMDNNHEDIHTQFINLENEIKMEDRSAEDNHEDVQEKISVNLQNEENGVVMEEKA